MLAFFPLPIRPLSSVFVIKFPFSHPTTMYFASLPLRSTITRISKYFVRKKHITQIKFEIWPVSVCINGGDTFTFWTDEFYKIIQVSVQINMKAKVICRLNYCSTLLYLHFQHRWVHWSINLYFNWSQLDLVLWVILICFNSLSEILSGGRITEMMWLTSVFW